MHKVRAKKYLGQHFLNDLTIAEKIAGSIISDPHIPLLEIGPGMGVLTRFLVHRSSFKVIEIDAESVEYLKQKYSVLDGKILEDDFLKVNFDQLFKEPFAIIGNFPYNISSQIFFRILENRDNVTEVVCMLQKEVAKRLASGPGNKTYGILSVLLQAYFKIEYLFTVNEGVFSPPPKVKSGVIRLTRNSITNLDCSETMFFKIVKRAFNQRRKTLRNSLREFFTSDPELLKKDIFNARPEQLTVNDFVFLANLAEG